MMYRHRVLGFLCLIAAITYLDRVAISVAGPRMQESLNISPEMWGWVVGIFSPMDMASATRELDVR